MIVDMEREENEEDLLEKGGEIKRRWGVGIDEDLTMEERKARWRILEKARLKRARDREVIATKQEIVGRWKVNKMGDGKRDVGRE